MNLFRTSTLGAGWRPYLTRLAQVQSHTRSTVGAAPHAFTLAQAA